MGVNISACADAVLYAFAVGVQSFLPASLSFSRFLSMFVIPPSLFNYAANLCGIVPKTLSGWESVVLCGCLRMNRKDGTTEKER